MIGLTAGLRVYLACGVTDMRKGMVGLSMLVQQNLARGSIRGRSLCVSWTTIWAHQANPARRGAVHADQLFGFILHLFRLSVRILMPLPHGWPLPDRRGDPIDCSV
jgi:hypothetical protein